MNRSAYQKLPKHQGVYKHKTSKRYLAIKKIRGKQHCETFDNIRDALSWRATYDGIKKKKKVWERTTPTLLEIWELMRELHFPTLEKSTQMIWERRFKVLEPLYSIHMEDFTPSAIDEWLEKKKDFYRKLPNNKRFNLRNELNLLSMICNWYRNDREYGDYKFISPVLDRHRKACIIRDLPMRNKKIAPEDAFRFFDCLPTLYRDLAMFQYLTASRIGETAGVQIANIDLEKREVMIKECCVWDPTNKMFQYLKAFPKNKEVRYCYLNDLLLDIVKRRLKAKVDGCDFLFHYEGQPLNYCTIQSNYRSAQRKAGIKQTGTHMLRHGMATLTRYLTRSLDATMAMTGHKDIKLADHYSEIGKEVQRETSLQVEEHLKKVVGGFENVVKLPRRKE